MPDELICDADSRNDPDKAAAILKEAFNSKEAVKTVLLQLAESIRVINAVAPNASAVTLSPDGFRLNVARGEVLTAFRGEVRVLMEGRGSGKDESLLRCISPSPYKSVRGENFIFRGSITQFKRHRDAILDAHRDYLYEAGLTRNGKPVKETVHRKSRSPGLVELAQKAAL